MSISQGDAEKGNYLNSWFVQESGMEMALVPAWSCVRAQFISTNEREGMKNGKVRKEERKRVEL